MSAALSGLPLRLAWVPTLAMLALVATLYGAAAWPLGADLRRAAALRVEQDAGLIGKRIELGVDRRLTEVRQLARGLRGQALDELPRLRGEIDFLRSQSNAYAWLGVADAQGRVLVASHGWLEGQSLRGRPVFEQGRRAAWFGEFHPAKLLKPFLVGSEQAEVWVADVAAPITAPDGELQAVVVAHLNADWIRGLGEEVIGEARRRQFGLRWTLLQSNGQAPLTGGGDWPAQLPDGDAATAVETPQQQSLLIASRRLNLGAQDDLRWKVLVAQDLDLALAPQRRLYLLLGGFALLTLVIGGAAALWLTRLAARPYAALFSAARQRFHAAGTDQPEAEFLQRLGDELVAALPLHNPQAEALLRRLASNAQQLQRMLDHLPMGVALCDAGQRVVHANRTFAALLGREAGELRGQSALELLLPSPADAPLREQLQQAGEPAAARSASFELQGADGRRLPVHWQRVPLFDREQRLDSVLMLAQDRSGEVGERRRADALQRRFAVLVNSALSDAFVMLDADGRVLDWSQGASHLTGWSAEAARGRGLAELLEAPAQDLLDRVRQDGQAVLSRRMRRADGSSFIAQGRLYRLPDDDGLALIFSDATRALEAARRVEESEARLAGVISGASDAIISTDAEGRVLLFNPAAERIFRVTQAEMLGQPLDRLLPAAERAAHPARMAGYAASEATRRPMGVGKVGGLRSDGEPLVLEAAISAAQVGGRRVLTAILRDVSERDRAEQRLVDYQLQLTELTQRLLAQEKETTRKLAQSLHDELGQTLAALRLMVDAGLQQPEVPAWVRRLDGVVGTANRQVREVLTELRPPLLDDQGLRAALVNELQQQQGRHEGVALQLDWQAAAEQRWPAEVEYAAFMVAREALGNALRHAQARHIGLRCSGSDRELDLCVDDDGVGDAELASRLRPGHLGLVGMRERALAIGARLEFESGPARGTSVQLRWGQGPR